MEPPLYFARKTLAQKKTCSSIEEQVLLHWTRKTRNSVLATAR